MILRCVRFFVAVLCFSVLAIAASAATVDLGLQVTGLPNDLLTDQATFAFEGTAGITADLTGSEIVSMSLPHLQATSDKDVHINLVTAAAKATLIGTVSLGPQLQGQKIAINGVTITLTGTSVANYIDEISGVAPQTGVVASIDASSHLVLTQQNYGSSARIDVTNGTAVFGSLAESAAGWDAWADVYTGWTATDAIPLIPGHLRWSAGKGCTLADGLGDTITLTPRAASCVHDLFWQTTIHISPIADVQWTNQTTGQSGACTGASHWTASIPLRLGQNTIAFRAHDPQGNEQTVATTITRRPVAANIRITSPVHQWPYRLNSDTVDIAGVISPHASLVGAAVVSADLSALPVTNSDSVNISTAAPGCQVATAATLTGTAVLNVDASAYDITINGVTIWGDRAESFTVNKINEHMYETGVVASADCSHHLVLTQLDYGSDAVIDVTHGTAMFGAATAHAAGRDVIAKVTKSDGSNLTDDLWVGKGMVIHDSLGNSITMTTIAAIEAYDFGRQIDLTPPTVAPLKWTNDRTGETGSCTGGVCWSATGIRLEPGINNITVSSEAGDMDTAQISRVFSTLGEAIRFDDGSYVSLPVCTVSAGTEDLGGCFYMQAPGRSSGIKVTGFTADRNSKVTVDGIIRTVNGERELQASWHSTEPGTEIAKPLGIANRALSKGLSSASLLVRAWGGIKDVEPSYDPTWFTIDDGSGNAVKCILPQGVYYSPMWTYVAVTGISASQGSGPIVRVRDADDIRAF